MKCIYELSSIKQREEIITQTAQLMSDYNIDEKIIKDYKSFFKQENELQKKIYELLTIDFSNLTDNSYQDYRSLIVLMSNNYSLIIVCLMHELVTLRVLKKENYENKEKFANICLNVYAPLAHRLGIYAIKTELEELSLYYLDKEIYMKIVNELEIKKVQRDRIINEMITKLHELLDPMQADLKIFGRSKSIYSIYKKMIDKNKNIEDLFDLYAIRILCEDKIQCYTILGIIHNDFPPIEGRFKDYIAVKKANLYQSLHTSIDGVEDKVFEIQIRTYEMDDIAENGIAAHWLYKEKKSNNDLVEKLHLFRDLSQTSSDSNASKDIFETSIYTFTPNKKIIILPVGSTPIDFAYSIHSKVAEQMTGAIVNNKIVKLNYKLKSGDFIEVRTKKGFIAPSKEWLDFARTERAKKKINASLRKQNDALNQELINIGKENFKTYIKKLEEDLEEVQTESELNKIIRFFGIKRLNQFYYQLGNDELDIVDLEKYFNKEVQSRELKMVNLDTSKNKDNIYIIGASGVKKQLAKCCNPVAGDDIFGVIVNGVGIKIHKTDCLNIIKNDKLNKVNAKWSDDIDKNEKYETEVKVIATDRTGLLTDIMNSISKQNVSVGKVNSKINDLSSTTRLLLYVNNKEQLEKTMVALNNIVGVTQVDRVLK